MELPKSALQLIAIALSQYKLLKLFLWSHFYLLLCLAITAPAAAACISTQYDEQALVDYVHDGDTLILQDRRKLRIIGLDTPELATEKRAAEPLAEHARDVLRTLIKKGDKINLQFDKQKHDRYQRLLAHVFLTNGQNATALMLTQGLATVLILPPNILYADCYSHAQQQARKQARGIWQRPEWQAVALAELTEPKVPHYYLLTGYISSVQHNKQYDTIHLSDGEAKLKLVILGEERALFAPLLATPLTGRKVLVQGWLNQRQAKLQIRLRHPSALHILDD